MRHLVPGRLDLALLAGALALLALGVLAVSSAGTAPGADVTLRGGPGMRHALLGVAGVVALLAAALVDYRLLARLAPLLYLGVLALLVVVLVAGAAAHGSRRWLEVGPVTFQPSELAKLALVLALAAFLAERPRGLATVLASVALALPAALLVLLEPDTGTSLVLGLGWLGVVVAAGAPWRILGGLLATALGVVPLLLALAVPAYQRERLAVFLDPARDPLGSGFNVRQAEVAIGSGGLTGDGFLGVPARALEGGSGAAESALTHVAARSSDFVFAQVGEDLGLVGTLAIVTLFTLIALRGYSVARTAPDELGRLLAAGLTTMLIGQAVLHIAVNVRLFPATGITLPLVSAGGTSVLATCLAIGLIESVAAQRLRLVRPPGLLD